MPSWVYVLTNASAPGLVKVGFTDRDPQVRAQELGSTGLPLPYVVAYAAEVSNGRQVEMLVHSALSRYHAGKEWYRCSVSIAQAEVAKFTTFSTGSSPLVPGHALEPYFSEAKEERQESAQSRLGANEDDSPLPPGHPSRGLL